jgi:hypothetical protein
MKYQPNQYRIIPVTSLVNINRHPTKTSPSQGRYTWYNCLAYLRTFVLPLHVRDSYLLLSSVEVTLLSRPDSLL